MSNRHVVELSAVYTCLFEDAIAAFPELRSEFERDLERLLTLVGVRGLHLYVVDLPNVGKHFDRCLANGQYRTSGLPLTKRYTSGVVIPKFLRGLYRLIFDEGGHLLEERNYEAIFFVRQICYLAKKAKFYCGDKAVEDEVLNFFLTDTQLPEPEGFWSCENPKAEDVSDTYTGFAQSEYYAYRAE